jgi:peptidoglycan/LPS O-acetylase OafA/YrhL
MGWQPSLDGVRAVSVIAVMLYHAGFSWFRGGFFGVEVFFVVSGFLITSLMIEERERAGVVSLRMFWLRRFRRLLPALLTMLVAVASWAALFGTAEQHWQMRRDIPWGLSYLANWGQISSDTAYFAGSPTLLRHLWSLAVEEQWYVLWPLAFLLLSRRFARDTAAAAAIGRLAMVVMLATAAASFWGHTNFLYLSTLTRSSGLLLGAALAYVWRPWRLGHLPSGRALQNLDRIATGAVVVLAVAVIVGRVESQLTYVVLMPLVTASSAALVAVVVHPGAGWARWFFSSRPLVVVGQRSYGLYLWSWPISLLCGAAQGSLARFALAMAITVPVSEACYRFIEKPVRQGALGAWWRSVRDERWRLVAACAVLSVSVLGFSLVAFYRQAPPFDRAVGGRDAGAFDTSVIAQVQPVPANTAELPPIGAPVTTVPDPRLRLVIVGDSQAHALAVNLPDGSDEAFNVTNGAVEGCGVHTSGVAVSSREGFSAPYSVCADVAGRWAAAAKKADAQVALVVLGAWDVFDIDDNGERIAFGTPAGDQRFLADLQLGIDALKSEGVHVALLEVPCMRPVSAEGAAVPPLPERGDDGRVGHLNDLLRRAAANDPANVTFVAGPPQWCNDPAISSSLEYRWDGVHVYKPGAKLIIETVAATLLALPR